MADDDCEEARSDVRLACVADVDGDLEPPRRVVRGSSVVRATVRVPPGVLCHGASFAVSQAPGDTTVAHAGLTVWPAALLLCEHLVAHHRGRLRAVLELGAGTGLCSLMASWLGASVTFATDADVKSLELCSENLAQNTHWLKSDVRVRKLDWLRHSARAFDLDHLEIEDLQLDSGNFAWRPDDVQHLREVSVVLAADVFYGIESAHVLVEKLRCVDRRILAENNTHRHQAAVTVQSEANYFGGTREKAELLLGATWQRAGRASAAADARTCIRRVRAVCTVPTTRRPHQHTTSVLGTVQQGATPRVVANKLMMVTPM
eukprot:TRINITY_DN3631_c0_g1_i7.p1 TRINITY_DN3631_c0_g1~~TRINITY_DN3631_c0_g1_i7.p1  ORF type:complete len:318 (-),score=51.99 TRINITY_DN3631_c0_g1_i7:38-991(-)